MKAFMVLTFLIVVLAVFFRIFKYTERIKIIADHSRDVQVATYAGDNLKFPLTGNFASAGPFFYGPWWYYFLEVVSFIPIGTLKFWYIATTLSLFFIFLIFKLGQEIENKFLGILAALFAAVSPAQIQNSLGVWNPSITPLLVLLSLFFAVRSIKNAKFYNLFFVSFFTVLAFTIHFQNILILPIIPITMAIVYFKFRHRKKLSWPLLFLIIGAFIPLIPLIYFDMTNHWFNSRNFLIYLLVDQYKIWVPNRWLTYATIYWPQTVSYIIGGSVVLSFVLIFSIGSLVLINLKKVTKNTPFFLIAITFFIEIILFRYYRGERVLYLSYFSHPTLFILSAWAVYKIIRINRLIGFVFLLLITFFTVNRVMLDIHSDAINLGGVEALKKDIYNTFPSSTFNIWECSQYGAPGHPLSYFIYEDGRESSSGINISVCENPGQRLEWELMTKMHLQGRFKDGSPFFKNVSTEITYKDTIEWWQKSPPKKGQGNFWKFVIENRFGN